MFRKSSNQELSVGIDPKRKRLIKPLNIDAKKGTDNLQTRVLRLIAVPKNATCKLQIVMGICTIENARATPITPKLIPTQKPPSVTAALNIPNLNSRPE